MLTLMATTFFAGFLTSLTPCVYPMIPLSIGYLGSRGQGLQKRTLLAFTFGQVLMFSLMGLAAVQLGEVFGFLSESKYIQIATGLLLGTFAYYSWKEQLPHFLSKLNFARKSDSTKPFSLFSAIAAGLLSTIVASPCSTPVLGGVLLMISKTESIYQGVFLMILYGLGLSTIFLVLGLGLFKSKNLPRSGVWMKRVHFTSVLLLAGSSIYFLGKGFSIWNI